ncbi:MAG: hypothetical protein IPN76_02915 [Saprospiraceae bacterium]|nr:hypothetical protein [Saprospiraceae bacterium]
MYEINHRAITVLCRELGIANTLRFIRQFSTGQGDYTQEREALHEGKTIDSIMAEIRQMRKEKR